MKRLKRFLLNGLLMTVVSLFMRSVSVSFHVYLSDRIGATALGMFTLISTVYGFSVTLATSGIQLATTRLVSEAVDGSNGKKDTERIVRIIKQCVTYALCFSITTALLLFFLAPLIGEHWLGDSRTILSLKVLALSLPAIALSSCFSGYFIAVRRIYKNVLVTIGEQSTRIAFCIALLSLFCANDVESACLAVVTGGVVADLTGCLLQMFLYGLEKNKSKKSSISPEADHTISRDLLHIALPVAFSAYVRSGLVTLEHLLIPIGLKKHGSSRETSLAAYGTVHSMVFPLALFPSAVTASFAGLLIPEMTEANARGDTQRIQRVTEKALQSVLLFAIGVSGIFLCFSQELGTILYPNTNAGAYLFLIAPLIPVMYLDTAVDSILKGLGEQVYTMGVNIADSMLSVILVWILIPNMGIGGYLLTVYFTELTNATLSITRLLLVTKIRPSITRWIVFPILAVILATTASRALLSCFSAVAVSKVQLAIHIGLTALLYLGVLVFLYPLFHLHRKKQTGHFFSVRKKAEQ